jgi:hypothetical protein
VYRVFVSPYHHLLSTVSGRSKLRNFWCFWPIRLPSDPSPGWPVSLRHSKAGWLTPTERRDIISSAVAAAVKEFCEPFLGPP